MNVLFYILYTVVYVNKLVNILSIQAKHKKTLYLDILIVKT